MIIRLTENINSTCGEYIAAKGEELEVSSYDEKLAIYNCEKVWGINSSTIYEVCEESAEVVVPDNMKSPDDWVMTEQERPTEESQRPFKIKIIRILPEMKQSGINLGDEFYSLPASGEFYRVESNSWFWVFPKYAAEVIETRKVLQDWGVANPNDFIVNEAEQEKPVIEKLEHVTYNNEKNRVEYEFPNLDMKFKKEWEPVTCTEPKIERNCPKIKLLRALMSNCGQCKTSKDSVLDIIYTDNDKKIHLCKGPFSEAVTYDVPFFYGELMQDEKPEQEKPDIKFPHGFIVSSLPNEPEQEAKQKLPSKYHRANTLKHKDFIDFYDIINLLQSNGEAIPPEIQHALKKLMYNDRGHKNMIQDKKEASWSIDRWFENNEL